MSNMLNKLTNTFLDLSYLGIGYAAYAFMLRSDYSDHPIPNKRSTQIINLTTLVAGSCLVFGNTSLISRQMAQKYAQITWIIGVGTEFLWGIISELQKPAQSRNQLIELKSMDLNMLGSEGSNLATRLDKGPSSLQVSTNGHSVEASITIKLDE